MFKIRVIGLDEGKHNLNLEIERFSALNSDYVFDNAAFNGEMIIDVNKINIKGVITADVELVCDRSGKEFTESVKKEIDLLFKFNAKGIEILDDDIDSSLYKLEGNQLNLNDLMFEELLLALPLKKIAPDYRDIEFEKLFPTYSAGDEKKEDAEESTTWNALKKIRLN